ncbi:MAG TPA: type 1 glutamine amidotransferase [Novimethylophilus sp.]|jgi:GMP synthase-like glutamine amidotransferase|uniref:type 1 glutamine amidotransferase n=1 Tax=Novimethylophilus sp. TaxID=2137426 RepID=UPI002F40C161
MKPVAIFRHARTEGPGYLAEFLDSRELPWRLIRIDAGDPLPAACREFSGLVFMGGPMSVNDDLPWIAPVLALIRGAVAAGIPVLGHCLGGQLMSKALGGSVAANPVKEIGWGRLAVEGGAEAAAWFGAVREFQGFHWHGETFTLPAGAVRILSSPYCSNQAFALGKHLGFQCHIEMTADMVREWCRVGAEEALQAAASPGVQALDEMQRDLPARIPALNAVAQAVYTRWTEGLAR